MTQGWGVGVGEVGQCIGWPNVTQTGQWVGLTQQSPDPCNQDTDAGSAQFWLLSIVVIAET